MTSPVNAELEQVVLAVVIQLIVIIAAARLVGAAFRFLGQPQVCGEIAAGLILGPSFLGGLFPKVFEYVFRPSLTQVFSVLSQIGLILLMFLIGLEFDFSHLRNHGRAAASISVFGIVLPFSLGFDCAIQGRFRRDLAYDFGDRGLRGIHAACRPSSSSDVDPPGRPQGSCARSRTPTLLCCWF